MKIAIIGCGNIGSKRVLSILKDKSCKIKFIVGRPKPKNQVDNLGKKIAKKIKCEYTTNRIKVLNSDIDAVILSTPPDLFLKYGSEILRAKKHLLIEKPLGLNSKEAKILTNLAKKNKLFLKTGFNLRFDDGLLFTKKLLIKKIIGKVYFFKIDYVNGSVKTNKNKVGALKDIGIHSINLFEYFINKDFNVVSNSLQNNEYFKDDNGFLILKSNSVIANIHYSFVRWENRFFLEISGSKGSIVVKSLPKWGEQQVILSKRVYPSGPPIKKVWKFKKENSWLNEWKYFKKHLSKKPFVNQNEGYITMNNVKKILNKKK